MSDDGLERWMESPVSRRRFLRGTGRGAAGVAMASLLAACGGGGSEQAASKSSLPPIAGELKVAQWPLYIDRAKGGARPTLEAFTKKTDIKVDYREIISDNQAWFSKLYPQLSSGQPTGWDQMCIADWLTGQMYQADYLEPLHWDALPTATKNMLPAFRDPAYDPKNAHSVPWQGGVTGVAYYPDLVGGKLTQFSDLWNTKLAGHVGMLTEMTDAMSLTLLTLGVDPVQATLDDAKRAQQRLIEQRDAGIVRNYYGQDYIDALVNKDTWASMAWSGDVFYWKYLGGAPDLEFMVPDEGGIIWASADVIPVLAAHPADAHAFMDFYYRPEIAVQVTDWVLYMTPVEGVQDLMRQKAQQATGADKAYYEALSESPLLFPPDDPTTANLFEYKAYTPEEYQAYADLFGDVINA